jgi:uncharacterized DUF497 family protein
MAIVFDPAKNAQNVARRGLPFELVAQLEWEHALIIEDTRKDYGEMRLIVVAPMLGRIYVAIVTPRESDLRVISFRKANAKETKRYVEGKI